MVKSAKFDYDVIKGRIAEALIEQMFLRLGYDVFRYGMENTVPGITQLLAGIRNDAAMIIKRMPDFVIKKGDQVFFVEVKFRSNEYFSLSDLEKDYFIDKDYPFKNAFFIIVSKYHIKCISYAELKEGKSITPKSAEFYLANRKEFEMDKEVIVDFCGYALKFFEGV